jgi:hypothetical protein
MESFESFQTDTGEHRATPMDDVRARAIAALR